VILTPTRAVPASWFGELRGKNVLCLASGGGQQAPVLAAAGANVVSFDLSEEQLRKDREVAERENFPLRCIRGNMSNLSEFPAESFDLIFHPVSNVFVPNVMVVWRGCYHVLKPGGRLLAGFMNPSFFLYEDSWSDEATPLNRFSPVAMVTLAVKVTSNNALLVPGKAWSEGNGTKVI
jgi:ubiquinone/menaquinone biosynthesis C-methylase UbiE